MKNVAMTRRGTVWIAPTDPVPTGLMADPVKSTFWVSWQHDDEGVLEDAEIVGAETAIAWGRERAQSIRIRLGHTDKTYFSAGETPEGDLPEWPPGQPPRGGWWSRGDPRTPPPQPPEPWQLGVASPEIRRITRPSESS